jgi:DNA-binding response OmpR family regulator
MQTGDTPHGECCASVLVLEDDEALREMLDWELSELGYRVVAVGSCDEARTAAVARDFDLALFDIGLPDGDGADLAVELVRQRPEMRIVLCTGEPERLCRRGLPSEVITCLTKPVSIRRLQAAFRRCRLAPD